MQLGWVAASLACEWIAYSFLTRNWGRASRLELAKMADAFAAVPDLAAFILVHLVAAVMGLLFAWGAANWFAKVVVFIAVFWFTAKLLRFVSLLVVVRYVGISPADLLRTFHTAQQAERDRTVALRAESSRLIQQLQLDEETGRKLMTMTVMGQFVNEEEPVAFLRYILTQGAVLTADTLDARLQKFRTQSR